jgi:hypothetical protein
MTANLRSLCKIGGVAALLAAILFRRNLAAEYFLLRGMGLFSAGPTVLPVAAIDWFSVLQTNRFLGLTLLNLFDLVNYGLVALIFLGLYAALRQVNKSYMLLAMMLTLVGVAVYFASNQAFAMLSLSDQYAAATSDAQRNILLAAGQALLAIQNTGAAYGPGLYLSFLFVNLGGVIIAVVMLRSTIFGRITAWSGILANVLALGYYVTLIFAPAMSFIPISLAAPCLLVWYIRIGVKLLRLGSGVSIEAM